MKKVNTLKFHYYKDESAKPILEKISKYTQQAETMQIPYWVFAQNSNPIGLVALGKEPVQLLAPPGTPMALIYLIDPKQPKENIESFALEALKLAVQKNNIEYALATFSSKEEEAVNQFKKIDFQDLDDSYKMICQLDKPFKPSEEIQFSPVQKEEMRQFIKTAKEILQDSPDIMLTKALKHFLELPDAFLNFYYTLEKFYFAKKNQRTIGVLNFNVARGLISNIGVDPKERGKGYGRQIMLFGLEQLKNSGCKQAYLRVHVENKPAVHLYESLGFVKAERYKSLIWRKDKK